MPVCVFVCVHSMWMSYNLSLSEAMSAPDQSLKGLFEVLVKDGVDERVNERVEIAQPSQEVCHLNRRAAAVTRVDNDLLEKERQPADDKRPEDQPERGRRPPLPRARDPLAPERALPAQLAPGTLPGDARAVALHGRVGEGLLGEAEGVRALGVLLGGAGGDRAPVGRAGVAAGAAGLPAQVQRLSGAVDLIVEDQDEQQGDVEGAEGGVEGEGNVVVRDRKSVV